MIAFSPIKAERDGLGPAKREVFDAFRGASFPREDVAQTATDQQKRKRAS